MHRAILLSIFLLCILYILFWQNCNISKKNIESYVNKNRYINVYLGKSSLQNDRYANIIDFIKNNTYGIEYQINTDAKSNYPYITMLDEYGKLHKYYGSIYIEDFKNWLLQPLNDSNYYI